MTALANWGRPVREYKRVWPQVYRPRSLSWTPTKFQIELLKRKRRW